MKRKEARAIVKQYKAECEAKQSELLGGAVLESFPLFDGITKDRAEEVVKGAAACFSTLDEMEGGDNAKSLLFFLMRNMSILAVVLGEPTVQSLLQCVGEAIGNAMGRRRERV